MENAALTLAGYWSDPQARRTNDAIKATTHQWFVELGALAPASQKKRDRLRWAIVWLNRPLVLRWINRHKDRDFYGELVDEAHDALWRSTEKFDVTRGFEFSTYATWAVRKSCGNWLKRRMKRDDKTCCIDGCDPPPHHDPVPATDEARMVSEIVRKRLPPRERQAIAMRFGLHGHEPQTLKAVGDALGMSKERARQIEARGLRLLRPMVESFAS